MKGKVYVDPDIGEVSLVKSARGRRISIRVHPARGVVVSVPQFLRYDDGVMFFLRKREWVLETLGRQKAGREESERSGKAVGLLGDGSVVRTLLSEIRFRRVAASCTERKMAVTVSSHLLEDVRTTGRLFLSPDLPVSAKTVAYPDTAPPENSPELAALLESVLVNILRDEARSLLPQKLSFLAGRYGFNYGRVAIKHNSSNWGSCSTRGNINLNLNLVRLPEPVCDYVLLHELCHLRFPDHGPEFHTLLEKLCQDNMKRLSLLMGPVQDAPDSREDSGMKPSMDYFRGLLSAMRRSRSAFPVHHVLEQEVKKYRLI